VSATSAPSPIEQPGAKLSEEGKTVIAQLHPKRFLALAQTPVAYDHYSLLRTIEDAWGLPRLGDAACDCAPPMADFFVPNTAARR
jgi:hypothetical protein